MTTMHVPSTTHCRMAHAIALATARKVKHSLILWQHSGAGLCAKVQGAGNSGRQGLNSTQAEFLLCAASSHCTVPLQVAGSAQVEPTQPRLIS